MQLKIHCKYDELIKISELAPHPKNRNKHPEEQIERLAKIIAYQGIRAPIVVSRASGYIVKGHGTLKAIEICGSDTAPVVYQDFDDEDQEYLFVQSDNAIASWAELDLAGINLDLPDIGPFDLDLLGIRDFEMDPPITEPQCDEDDAPEAPKEPVSRLGDIYELGNHRLMCGDSTDKATVEKLMNGEKAELCFTSPPYADQREYNGGKELSTEHLARFIMPDVANYYAVNLGYSRKNGEVNPYWDDYIKHAKSSGLKLLSWNVWHRGRQGSIGLLTAMFIIAHEWIFIFGKEAKKLNETIENKSSGQVRKVADRQKDGLVKYKDNPVAIGSYGVMGTVLEMPSHLARNEGVDHPAMFPISFPESYIEAMTGKNDLVYEPFGGSGSTLIACEKTKRRCFMMELDPHYIDVIVTRWCKYTGRNSIKRNGEPMEWVIDG